MGVVNKKTAPCSEACPVGVDVPRYLRHIRSGRFEKALGVILERLPFPFVCGYACIHPCETGCGRRQLDDPISIRMLKRVAAELGWKKVSKPVRMGPTGKKAAVVGSGPCGLTAAYFLSLQGHQVTVFEALAEAGGMLRYGIPGYRLPNNILDRDIEFIEKAGVTILTEKRIEDAEALLGGGFDAVFIASGAWRGLKMGIPGENDGCVLDGLSFLKAVNSGNPSPIGGKVIVVGGGNTAIDAARVSRRLKAEVTILYRRTRAEMPAGDEEIKEALEEGVKIEYLTAPIGIERGSVTCVRMDLGQVDASGRPCPVPRKGSEYVLSADTLIVAVGQGVKVPASSLDCSSNGSVVVNPDTLASSVEGIFAGGDAVMGPSSIIDATAQGRKAAVAIDRFLGGAGLIERPCGDDALAAEPAPHGTERRRWRTISPKRRVRTLSLAEKAYDRKTAIEEAGRCMSCDLRSFEVEVNSAICKGCGYCSQVCSLGVFDRSDRFNPSGYQPLVAAQPERCMGCLRCLYICPDFCVTIREAVGK